mgnify:CR=1 FL=1
MNNFQKYLTETAKRHNIDLDEVVIKTVEQEITVRGVIKSAGWFDDKQQLIISKIEAMEEDNEDIRLMFNSMAEVILYA